MWHWLCKIWDRLFTDDRRFTTDLYFEAHVTIEPVFDERLAEFAVIAAYNGFKVAELLMQKRIVDTATRSKFDTFTTTRGKDYTDVLSRTMALVNDATDAGYQVWRYKIENTLLDVRLKNVKNQRDSAVVDKL